MSKFGVITNPITTDSKMSSRYKLWLVDWCFTPLFSYILTLPVLLVNLSWHQTVSRNAYTATKDNQQLLTALKSPASETDALPQHLRDGLYFGTHAIFNKIVTVFMKRILGRCHNIKLILKTNSSALSWDKDACA